MTNAVAVKGQENDLVAFFEAAKSRIALALPKHLTPERMIRICLTEVRKNPKLAQCDKASLIGAVMECSILGLEPGGALGHAYLIPFCSSKNKCFLAQAMIGYKGMIDLARRSGQIQSISARAVYENDQFEYAYGLEDKLVHKPCAKGNPGDLTYVYAVAKFKDGGHQFEVLSRDEVESIRSKSKDPDGIWKEHFGEMARKSAIRRIAKYLPLSPEMVRAFENDNAQYDGVAVDHARQLGVVDVDYVPAPMKSEDAATIADINAEAEKAAADDRIADLRKKVDDAADAAQKPRPDTSKMNEQQLVALLTAIRSPS